MSGICRRVACSLVLAFALVVTVVPPTVQGLGPSGEWSPSYYAPSRGNGVAYSPEYASDRTVFTATSAGLYYSNDGATTWKHSATTIDPATIYYGVAVSPNFAADKTVFSATFGWGVAISTDGGKTSRVATGSEGNSRCVAVSPDYEHDGTVITGSMRGLKRSTDRGATWKTLTLPGIPFEEIADTFAVGFSPNYANDRTILCWVNNVGGFRSTDGGDSWELVGDATALSSIWRFAFSPDFATDRTVYASSQYWCRVYKSTDGGKSWGYANLVAAEPSKMARVTGLALSPGYAVDHTVYAAAERKLYKSTDHGENWTSTEASTSTGWSNAYDLAISPNFAGDGEMVIGREYHGVTRTTDRGLTFSAMTVGLADQTPYAIGFSPAFSQDKTVFLGAERGVFRSTDGGTTWTSLAEKTGMIDSYSLAVSPAFQRDRTLIAGGQGTRRSTDGGETWTQNTSISNVRSLAMSPDFERDRTVFAGAVNGDYMNPYKSVFRSTDGGQNWTAAAGIPSYSGFTAITGVAVSPDFANDHTVYASSDWRIFKSTDGGANYSQLFGAPAAQTIAVSPDYARDHTVVIGLDPTYAGGGVWRSTDGGENWESYVGGTITASTSVLGFAFSPGYAGDGLVYAATGAGLKARAKGTTWVDVPVVNGAPGFYSIALSPSFQSDGVALAGSDGFGVTRPGNPPTPIIKPSAPGWVTPASDGQEGFSATPTIEWSSVVASPVVDAYEVGVYDGRNLLLASQTSTATTFTVPAGLLVDHHAYYAKVRAHSKNGWSDPAARTFYRGSAPPAAPAPTLTAPVNDATGLTTTPLLDWADVGAEYGVDWYRVRVYDAAGREVVSAEPTSSQWTATAGKLQAGRRYYWDALTHNARGYSDPSETRAFLAGAAPATVPVAPQPRWPAPAATWVPEQPYLTWRDNPTSDVVDYYWAEVWDGEGNLVSAGPSADPWWQVPAEDKLARGAYAWRVSAHNYTGWGPVSNEVWFWVGKPPLPLPDTPRLVMPPNASVGQDPNGVTLQWASIPTTQEADGYYCAVYDEEGTLVTEKLLGPSVREWKVPAGLLNVSRAYVWAVWAHNDTGWSEASEFRWFATVNVPGPPPMPTDLGPDYWEVITNPTPTLTWNDYNGVGATQYMIDGAWIEIYEESGRRVYSGASGRYGFTVPAGVLKSGTWYLWAVCSHNVCGWGDWSYWGSFGLAPPPPPSTPFLLSPADNAVGMSTSGITLQCSSASNAKQYNFMLTDEYGNVIWDTWTTSTSVTVPSWLLQYQRWYGWGVWAANEGGETPSEMRFFMPGPVPTPPAVPTLYQPTDNAEWVDQGAFLDWSDSSGATGYRVAVYDKNNSVVAWRDTKKSEWSVPLGMLKAQTRYWWCVWATSGGGSSPDGEMRTFVCWGPRSIKSMASEGLRDVAATGSDAEPPGVRLRPAQNAVDVVAGANALDAVGVRGTGGYGGTSRMSVTGLPPGATASWSTTSASVGSTTTLTVKTTGATPEGVYMLRLTGVGGTQPGSANVALRVFRSTSGSFALGLAPSVRATTAGGAPVSYVVTVTAQAGFTGPVDLSVAGLPSGTRATFLPQRVTTTGSSVLTIETSPGVEPEAYALRVVGTSAGRSSSTLGRLDIYPPGQTGFTLTCVDASQTVVAGTEATWRFGVTPTGSMRIPVVVSVAGTMPAGASISWRVASPSGEVSASEGSSASVPVGGSADLSVSVPQTLGATSLLMLVSASNIETRATLPVSLRVQPSPVEPATIAVTASPRSAVSYGKSAVFSAQVMTGNQVVRSAVVSLWRSSDGGVTWTKDAPAVWSATSAVYKATSKTLSANTLFSMRSSGTSRTVSVASKPAVLTVKAHLGTPSTPSKVKKSRSFTVTGSLKPYHSGATKLYFYRKVGSKWRPYKSYSAKNSLYKGYTRYSYKAKFKSTGSWYVIAKHSDASHASTTSPKRYFKVR